MRVYQGTDYFSGHSHEYAKFRPTYPPELVEYLAHLLAYRGVVWDCACGTGKLSVELARHFNLVCASDLSAKQIEQAPSNKGILYSAQPSEKTDFPDGYFDMVVVAQALHWLRHPEYFEEVHRVLGNGGVFAAIGYNLLSVKNPDLDQIIRYLWDDLIYDYWPVERKHIDDNYANIPFPFEPVEIPHFTMTHEWTVDELLGYLRTWSGAKLYENKMGLNPVNLVENEFREVWGVVERRTIHFPLILKVGRKFG